MVITQKQNVEELLSKGDLIYDDEEYQTSLSFYENAHSQIIVGDLEILLKCKIILHLMKVTYQLNRLKATNEYFGKLKSFCTKSSYILIKPFLTDILAIKGSIYMKVRRFGIAVSEPAQAIAY